MLGFLQVLRIYSLVDLLLLVYVVGADVTQTTGILCLWVSFLLLLEWRHQHEYRPNIRAWTWVALGGLGLVCLPAWGSVAFLVLGYIYTKKDQGYWAVASPIIRGLQTLVLVLVVGGAVEVALAAAVMIALRNLLGDLRDADKDAREGMNTIPVLLGLRHNVPHVHLVATCGTTAMWAFGFDAVAWWIVGVIWVIQIATYYVTPR